MFTLTTGYDAEIPVTLYKIVADVKSTFAIDAGATVQAAIVSDDRTKLLTDPVPVLQATTGSDWANSLIVVKFTAAQLSGLSRGDVKMEIQVDDNGKIPFIVDGTVETGHIS